MIRKQPIFSAIGFLLLNSLWASSAIAIDTRTLWQDQPTQSPTSTPKSARPQQPTHFRTLTLDFADLKNELAAVPASNSEIAGFSARPANPVTLALPLPEGNFAEFKLSDSGTLPPALAQRYPEIRSLKGSDGKGRQLRLDISSQGMKAMVYDQDGVWLVQPAETLAGKVTNAKARGGQYWSFRRNALPPSTTPFNEDILKTKLPGITPSTAKPSAEARTVTGNDRRDYRIAVAATSAYTAQFGGTVAGGLAAIVYMLNRVNEVFEKDLGVHLTLVNDNDKIIYTNPTLDPYNNIPPPTESEIRDIPILRQNVINLNKVIGAANFDVGHVVDTGSGGVVGAIGNTCMDKPGLDNKAAGTTGRYNPVGDAFYIDFVAHELGHQFGAWHTYNRCRGGRSTLADTSLEPGSGSTIMGYAGVCSPNENLQEHSDPYFHAISQEQINAWISSKGGACAAKRFNPNTAPWIDAESLPGKGKVLTIPARTPFVLKGKAEGSPNAVMTYTWEQFDAGPLQGPILKDDGKGPIFRSFQPNTSGERVFPRLAAVLGEEPLGNGEVYPTTKRQLKFRLTARDNLDTQATTASSDILLNVITTGRAFSLKTPTALTVLTGGSMQTTTWRIAKTNEAPISCPDVRIDLSVDGGHTYLPTPLAASVPNTGNASIMLPKLEKGTTQARIKVSCNNNVFFAVSPGNFIIQ